MVVEFCEEILASFVRSYCRVLRGIIGEFWEKSLTGIVGEFWEELLTSLMRNG